MPDTSDDTTHTTCDDCGCVYDDDKLQCPVCANRGQIDRIKDWIRGQE